MSDKLRDAIILEIAKWRTPEDIEYGRLDLCDVETIDLADRILTLPVPEFDYSGLWPFAPPGTQCAAMNRDGMCHFFLQEARYKERAGIWLNSPIELGIAPANWDRSKSGESLRMMPKEFER